MQQTVHDIRLEIPRNAEGSAWLLVISDCHYDSVSCRRDLLTRHLKEAADRDAKILIIGDFFDAMGGRYDPRRSKGKIRPEYNSDRYIDDIIDDAAEYLAPYAQHLSLISEGNHESALRKNLETDLIQRTVGLLRHRGADQVQAGTYQGWIRLMLSPGSKGGSLRQSYRVRYHHGHGGGGVVTKGTLWPQRRAAWWPDADIVVSGHIHEQWSFPVTRERLSAMGVPYNDLQMHLCLGTYKDETLLGSGWAIEKGMPPKPLGGWWIKLYWDRASERWLYQEIRAV